MVSIVMPAFNRAALIGQSIASVIAQTHRNWELIVVDDGSTDDTVERVSALGDHRITILSAGRVGNVARLRNLGAAAGTGQYLAFLDSDDIWVPEKLELQLSALRTAPQAWCYSDHGLLGPDGDCGPIRVGQFRAVSGRIGRELVSHETSAAMITWLMPRSLFDRTGGFDEALTLREDLDLAFRLAEAAEAVALPERLGFVREHFGRKTKRAADQHLKTALIFRRAAERAGIETSQASLGHSARSTWPPRREAAFDKAGSLRALGSRFVPLPPRLRANRHWPAC